MEPARARGELRRTLALLVVAALAVCACGPADDDVAAQRRRLENARRRDEALLALGREYSRRLADARGDRHAPAVRAFHDDFVPGAVEIYDEIRRAAPDTADGLVRLLRRTRDPRASAVYLRELARDDLPSVGALEAAAALGEVEVPADEQVAALEALHDAFFRLPQARPDDEELRTACLRSMSHLAGRATPAAAARAIELFGDVVRTRNEVIGFTHVRHAVEAIVALERADAVAVLAEAAFVFDPLAPGAPLEDLALQGLVNLGGAADRFVGILSGTAEEERTRLLAAAATQLEAARQADPLLEITPELRLQAFLTRALGLFGAPASHAALLREARDAPDPRARVAAARALGQLSLSASTRESAARALAAPLTAIAADPHRGLATRGAAVSALADLGTGVAEGRLIALVRDEEVPLRVRALGLREHARFSLASEAVDPDGVEAFFAGEFPALEAGIDRHYARAEICDDDLGCYLRRLVEASGGGEEEQEATRTRRTDRGKVLAMARRLCAESAPHARSGVRELALRVMGLEDEPAEPLAMQHEAVLAFDACAEDLPAEAARASRLRLREKAEAARRRRTPDAPLPTELLALRLSRRAIESPD